VIKVYGKLLSAAIALPPLTCVYNPIVISLVIAEVTVRLTLPEPHRELFATTGVGGKTKTRATRSNRALSQPVFGSEDVIQYVVCVTIEGVVNINGDTKSTSIGLPPPLFVYRFTWLPAVFQNKTKKLTVPGSHRCSSRETGTPGITFTVAVTGVRISQPVDVKILDR